MRVSASSSVRPSVLVLTSGVCDTAGMETHALPAPVAPAFEEIDIPVWAWALVALAAVVSYFVMLENGAVLTSSSTTAGTSPAFPATDAGRPPDVLPAPEPVNGVATDIPPR